MKKDVKIYVKKHVIFKKDAFFKNTHFSKTRHFQNTVIFPMSDVIEFFLIKDPQTRRFCF